MNKEKVVLLVSHCPDPLINKRLLMLSKDYNITIMYVPRGNNNFKKFDNINYIELNKKFENGKLFKRLFSLINLKKIVKKKLDLINPDYIYAFRLDMLLIVTLSKYKNKKIIYEVADLHNAIINTSRNIFKRCVKFLLTSFEKRAFKHVNLLSITSEKYYDVYFKNMISHDKVAYMSNIPDLRYFDNYKKKAHKKFTIGFIGVVRYKEQMKMLINAAEKTNINVLFAGIANDDEIEKITKNNMMVEYYGPYNYANDIANLYSKCDCIYSVYDVKLNNVKYALPNKLYEAIYCELPIIVSKNTYLSELVEKYGVGVSAFSDSEEDLIEKILLLKDNKDYYNQIVDNCKKNKDTINLEEYNSVFLNKMKKM